MNSMVPPSMGIAELIICVFDQQQQLHHHFQAGHQAHSPNEVFRFLNNPAEAFDSDVLRVAIQSRKPVSVALSYEAGRRRKHLHVLPYEEMLEQWRFVCLQVAAATSDLDAADSSGAGSVAEERGCLLLLDAQQTVRSVSPRIPEAFGYEAQRLAGMNLQDLLAAADVEILTACSPDTNEAVHSCMFQCADGSKRKVEIKKFPMPDQLSPVE